MDPNGHHGAGGGRGRGPSIDEQRADADESPLEGFGNVRLGHQSRVQEGAGRGEQAVPIRQPVPVRPAGAARRPLAVEEQRITMGARNVQGPAQPVRIPNLRGPSRPSNDTENRPGMSSAGAGVASGAAASAVPPPRPPRSPPTPPPPPETGATTAAPATGAAGAAAAAAGDAANKETSPESSVYSSVALSHEKPKQALFAAATGDKHKSVSEKFTFYREPTPPPLPLPRLESSPAVPPPAAGFYDYKYDHVAPPAPITGGGGGGGGTVCGVRKRLFWMLLAAVLLVVALAVGIGVGVGVGANNGSSPDEVDADKSPDTAGTTLVSTTTVSTATTTQDASTGSTLPTATTKLACPGADDTTYEIPDSAKTFRRFCGIDYDGSAQARDIGSVWTATMEDCMINCAGFPGCTACGWGAIRGDPGSDHRCWLKNSLGDTHRERTGWQFATLQQ